MNYTAENFLGVKTTATPSVNKFLSGESKSVCFSIINLPAENIHTVTINQNTGNAAENNLRCSRKTIRKNNDRKTQVSESVQGRCIMIKQLGMFTCIRFTSA